MELNTKSIQEVVQLNLDLVKNNNQIQHIKGLIDQLLHDKCDLSVSFKMHNVTKCEENKAVRQGNPDYTFFDGFFKLLDPSVSGGYTHQLFPPKDTMDPCKNTLNFEITDTNGVRILSILLAEKEEAKRLMLDRLNQLINPVVINFPAAANPNHDRYAAE